jgi:hypothetical protein
MSENDQRKLAEVKDAINKRLISLEAGVDVLKRTSLYKRYGRLKSLRNQIKADSAFASTLFVASENPLDVELQRIFGESYKRVTERAEEKKREINSEVWSLLNGDFHAPSWNLQEKKDVGRRIVVLFLLTAPENKGSSGMVAPSLTQGYLSQGMFESVKRGE